MGWQSHGVQHTNVSELQPDLFPVRTKTRIAREMGG